MDLDTTGLVLTLKETAERYAMFAPGQTVVIAVSGGPDSTALLHALAGMRADWQLTLVAAHLNHGFRGEEADADAGYVAALCARLNIDVRVANIDVPQVQQRRHRSAQEAAREVRHAFLRRVAEETGAARIALGHTRDDRVETILINLLRGAGPEGLSGFPAVDGPLVRPLYDVTRIQTRAYCADRELNPRDDSSNAKVDYLRNRTRSELLPYLRSYYNERVDAALLRMAELISADNAVLNDLAAAFLAEADRGGAEDEVVLDCADLCKLPLAMQRRVLRQAIERVRGHLQGVTFEMVEGIIRAVAQRSRHAITLPAAGTPNVRVQSDPARVRIFAAQPPSCPVPWQAVLSVPGRTRLPQARLRIEAALCATNADLNALLAEVGLSSDAPSVMILQPDAITLPLSARSWRPGDRIRLGKERGSKKLQDLFVNARVPASQRARIPVITDAEGVVLGVLGGVAAEKGRVGTSMRVPHKERHSGLWLVLIALPLDREPQMQD